MNPPNMDPKTVVRMEFRHLTHTSGSQNANLCQRNLIDQIALSCINSARDAIVDPRGG